MDCRRRSAVDDDRSRRWVVDDDRYPRRWAVDNDRSRIAFYQAEAKATLDRVDKNLDRIRKNLRSIRRNRMPPAIIPEYSSSSPISSASHKRHRFHNKPVVDDDYPPLELPLRWRDPPPFQWPDPLPDPLFRNQPERSASREHSVLGPICSRPRRSDAEVVQGMNALSDIESQIHAPRSCPTLLSPSNSSSSSVQLLNDDAQPTSAPQFAISSGSTGIAIAKPNSASSSPELVAPISSSSRRTDADDVPDTNSRSNTNLVRLAKPPLLSMDLIENDVEDDEDEVADWVSSFPPGKTCLESLIFDYVGCAVNFDALLALVARSPFLRRLRVNEHISSDRLYQLMTRAPQLTHLGTSAFSSSGEVGDFEESLKSAFHSSKSLICLSGFRDLAPEYLHTIYHVCINLTSLNFSYAQITAEQLKPVITRCHNLQTFWVLDSLGDEGLQMVAATCKKLRELRVFPLDATEDSEGFVSDVGLAAISEGCHELQSILYFCQSMTNAAVVAMSKNCQELVVFRLCIMGRHRPDHLTGEPMDEGFGAIVKNCRKLTRLAVSGLLTDRAFAYIGLYGKLVRTLSVVFAGDGDFGLRYVLEGCSKLQKLEIRDSPFGDAGLLSGVWDALAFESALNCSRGYPTDSAANKIVQEYYKLSCRKFSSDKTKWENVLASLSYGNCEKYAKLYHESDLIFAAGFTKDWLFAKNSYSSTNWQIEMLAQFNDFKAETLYFDWQKPLHEVILKSTFKVFDPGGLHLDEVEVFLRKGRMMQSILTSYSLGIY